MKFKLVTNGNIYVECVCMCTECSDEIIVHMKLVF
jgi:hypothetical protein